MSFLLLCISVVWCLYSAPVLLPCVCVCSLRQRVCHFRCPWGLSKQRGYSKIEDIRLLKSNLNLSAYACVCVCVQLRPEKQKSQKVSFYEC